MVSHARNLCSAFHPSKCTHTAVSSEQTHAHSHSSGQPFLLRCLGSSWGFGALLKGLTSVVVLKVEEYIQSSIFFLIIIDLESPENCTVEVFLRLSKKT